MAVAEAIPTGVDDVHQSAIWLDARERDVHVGGVSRIPATGRGAAIS